jgi:hypothetical protein
VTLPSCAVPPATDPVGPLTHHTGAELETAHHFVTLPRPRRVRSSSVEAADKPDVSPRLYGAVQGAARENACAHPHQDRTAFKKAAIAKSPWRTSPTPAVSRRPTSIGISPAAA